MAKKGRPAVDPLKNIAASGFIGYVEEEEEHSSDEPGVIWVEIEHIQSNPYQHAEDINPDDFAALVESIKADGFLGALNVSPQAQEEATSTPSMRGGTPTSGRGTRSGLDKSSSLRVRCTCRPNGACSTGRAGEHGSCEHLDD